MTSVELRVYDPTNTTLLGTLTRSYNRSYVHALSSAGVGRCTVDADDGQAALLQHRRVVRVRVDGTDRFAWIIDDLPRDDTGGADDAPSVAASGPGLTGRLGTGRGGAVVWPPLERTGARNRTFGWQTLGYTRPSSDGWTNPNADNTFGRYEKPTPNLPRLKGVLEGWPDRMAEWITHRPPNMSGGNVVHPGSSTMLLSRHLPSLGTETAVRIYAAGTNSWDVYLDGETVLRGSGFRDLRTYDTVLEPRTMPLGVHVRHQRTSGFRWDVLAFILTVVRLNEAGDPDGVLFRTYTPGMQRLPAPAQHWRMLADPDPIPGVTPGRIVRTLLDEAHARGTAVEVTAGFSATQDAAGQAWADELTHSFPIGTKLSDVLDQVCSLSGVEYTVTPGGRLDLVNRAGQSRSGVLGPLVSGRSSGEGVRATVLVGQAADGYRSRTSPSRIGLYGRIEDSVTLGTVPDRRMLDGPLARMLQLSRDPRDERDYVLSDSSPQPYADFGLGDTFPEGRVTQIAMSQDDRAGGVEWAVSLLPEGGA